MYVVFRLSLEDNLCLQHFNLSTWYSCTWCCKCLFLILEFLKNRNSADGQLQWQRHRNDLGVEVEEVIVVEEVMVVEVEAVGLAVEVAGGEDVAAMEDMVVVEVVIVKGVHMVVVVAMAGEVDTTMAVDQATNVCFY